MAAWVHVELRGVNYDYLKIAGGWLVTLPATGGLTFIPDPHHLTPPVLLE